MPVAIDDVIPDAFIEGTPLPDITSAAGLTISGANRAVFAFLATYNGTTTHDAVRLGGSTGALLTQIGTTSNLGGSFLGSHHSAWVLVAPDVGETVLFGDWAGDQERVSLLGASFTGVNAATPYADLYESNAGIETATTVRHTHASAPGDMAVMALTAFGGTGLALDLDADETGSFVVGYIDTSQTAGVAHIAIARPATAGTTTEISVELNAADDSFYSVKSFVIKAAGAGGVSLAKHLLQMMG